MSKIIRDIKLHLVKTAINRFMPYLNKIVPETKPPFKHLSTEILDRAMKRTYERIKEEMKNNKNISDRHLLCLTQTMRNVLVYIAENDCYYALWLNYVLLITVDECVNTFRSTKPTIRAKMEEGWKWTWFVNELSVETTKLLKEVENIENKPDCKTCLHFTTLKKVSNLCVECKKLQIAGKLSLWHPKINKS